MQAVTLKSILKIVQAQCKILFSRYEKGTIGMFSICSSRGHFLAGFRFPPTCLGNGVSHAFLEPQFLHLNG